MRSVRLVVLAASLAASLTAIPAHAAGGRAAPTAPVTPVSAAPAAPVTPVRMVGALFSSDIHAFDGYEVYTRDSTGRVRLSVVYFNTASLPAGTVLDVSANGVKVGTLVTTATPQGELLTQTAGLPSLALGSRISLTAAGKPIASGTFTLAI